MTSSGPTEVDTSKSTTARMYDFILGGTHNFPADREMAQHLQTLIPDLVDLAWANRGFHQRAVRWMAEQTGVRQFIDIGSGLPTRNNTHQIARAVDPSSRVAYVDIDPMVALHARELLTDDGDTVVVTGDLLDPDGVLGNPVVRELLDFTQPTGLCMTAMLHFVPDEADPWTSVARFVDALAPGSYLALSHGTNDMWHDQGVVDRVDEQYQQSSTARASARTKSEIERFFNGLEMVRPYEGAEPALTYVGMWGAEDPAVADDDPARYIYAGVARKP